MLGLDWLHYLLLALLAAMLAVPHVNERAVAIFQHSVVGTVQHLLALVGLVKPPAPPRAR